MPTRTPAEKERIKKKEKRNRIIVKATAALIVGIAILVCELKGVFKNYLSPNVEAGSVGELDNRICFLNELGIDDYSESGDSLIAYLSDTAGGEAQLIVENEDSPVSVAYITAFPLSDESAAPTNPFWTVDKPTSEPVEHHDAVEPYCRDIAKVLLPLGVGNGADDLESKLRNALEQIYSRMGDKAGFILGTYTVEIVYSGTDSAIHVKAVPAELP